MHCPPLEGVAGRTGKEQLVETPGSAIVSGIVARPQTGARPLPRAQYLPEAPASVTLLTVGHCFIV